MNRSWFADPSHADDFVAFRVGRRRLGRLGRRRGGVSSSSSRTPRRGLFVQDDVPAVDLSRLGLFKHGQVVVVRAVVVGVSRTRHGQEVRPVGRERQEFDRSRRRRGRRGRGKFETERRPTTRSRSEVSERDRGWWWMSRRGRRRRGNDDIRITRRRRGGDRDQVCDGRERRSTVEHGARVSVERRRGGRRSREETHDDDELSTRATTSCVVVERVGSVWRGRSIRRRLLIARKTRCRVDACREMRVRRSSVTRPDSNPCHFARNSLLVRFACMTTFVRRSTRPETLRERVRERHFGNRDASFLITSLSLSLILSATLAWTPEATLGQLT